MRLLIWLSLTLVVVVVSETDQSSSTGVRWRDLSVSLASDGTTILQPSSGFIPSGHLCGIIGPSGGGKSTFLAALGGVTPNHSGLSVSGNVWWQGVNSTKSTLSMKYVRCIVFCSLVFIQLLNHLMYLGTDK